ncbi:radical SAM/SPASM domain-containing protein [Uliginosibacterium sediminicola]|uniref:SPASM domain-containing protein n=1 Tax=Uliginosibacterium sediminicola TaxID=2024550 RepID=A0ABU9YVU9_9RHOO
MFDLHLLGEDESVRVARYDPHASTLVWSDTGAPVDLEPVGMGYSANRSQIELASMLHPTRPGRKAAKVRNLGIQLGLKCNQACSYCIQGETDHTIDGHPDDVPVLLAKIENNLDLGDGEGVTITFRGGEPFLYAKTLIPLATEIRKRYPRADLSTISNASLFTPELVDWIEAVDLAVTISHDGPGTLAARGADPLEDPTLRAVLRDAFIRRGRRMSVNVVLSAENNSIADVRDYLRAKLDLPEGAPLLVSTEGFATTFSTAYAGAADLSRAAQRQWSENVNRLFFDMATGRSMDLAHARERIGGFFETLAKAIPSVVMQQGCNQDRDDHLVVDTKGHVITCHNVSARDAGHHLGDLDNLPGVVVDTVTHWIHKHNCLTCPVLRFCKGGCHIVKREDQAGFCDDRFQAFMPYLAAALFYLTGRILTEIRGLQIRREGITSLTVIKPDTMTKGPAQRRKVIPIRHVSG